MSCFWSTSSWKSVSTVENHHLHHHQLRYHQLRYHQTLLKELMLQTQQSHYDLMVIIISRNGEQEEDVEPQQGEQGPTSNSKQIRAQDQAQPMDADPSVSKLRQQTAWGKTRGSATYGESQKRQNASERMTGQSHQNVNNISQKDSAQDQQYARIVESAVAEASDENDSIPDNDLLNFLENAPNCRNVLASDDVILMYPNFQKPFDLTTDASADGIGAVLSQGGELSLTYTIETTDKPVNLFRNQVILEEARYNLHRTLILFGSKTYHVIQFTDKNDLLKSLKLVVNRDVTEDSAVNDDNYNDKDDDNDVNDDDYSEDEDNDDNNDNNENDGYEDDDEDAENPA
ncbi:protein PFC0760c-like [Drosophila willistoni]|uniref:protein PFC0760c-like n=1 Tax=Drosophila willistoni TaxID=7260 RepID=UPI001F073BC1|nr:protein PFC0760c-like [Drosophila willistoni]